MKYRDGPGRLQKLFDSTLRPRRIDRQVRCVRADNADDGHGLFPAFVHDDGDHSWQGLPAHRTLQQVSYFPGSPGHSMVGEPNDVPVPVVVDDRGAGQARMAEKAVGQSEWQRAEVDGRGDWHCGLEK